MLCRALEAALGVFQVKSIGLETALVAAKHLASEDTDGEDCTSLATVPLLGATQHARSQLRRSSFHILPAKVTPASQETHAVVKYK